MRDVHPREIQIYRLPNGRRPFTEWLESIQDTSTQDRVLARLERLEDGNLSDCRVVGEGVFELRLHFGAGYRIYFGQVGNTIILLLCGGDKSSQTRDIERAKIYWLEYKEIR
jgi:putative addiction module killer protein